MHGNIPCNLADVPNQKVMQLITTVFENTDFGSLRRLESCHDKHCFLAWIPIQTHLFEHLHTLLPSMDRNN